MKVIYGKDTEENVTLRKLKFLDQLVKNEFTAKILEESNSLFDPNDTERYGFVSELYEMTRSTTKLTLRELCQKVTDQLNETVRKIRKDIKSGEIDSLKYLIETKNMALLEKWCTPASLRMWFEEQDQIIAKRIADINRQYELTLLNWQNVNSLSAG